MMQYKLRQFQGCHNGNCTNSKRSKPFHVVFHKKSFVIESTLRIFTDIITKHERRCPFLKVVNFKLQCKVSKKQYISQKSSIEILSRKFPEKKRTI